MWLKIDLTNSAVVFKWIRLGGKKLQGCFAEARAAGRTARFWFAVSMALLAVLHEEGASSLVNHHYRPSQAVSSSDAQHPEVVESDRGDENDLQSIARFLLCRGEYALASNQFSRLWQTSNMTGNPDRDRWAFYLGLCAEAQGKEQEAQYWFRSALNASGTAAGTSDRVAWYELTRATSLPSRRVEVAMRGHGALGAAEGQAQEAQHRVYLEKAQALLEQARKTYEADSSKGLESRIQLMSALLMYAELAQDESVTLYSNANDSFAYGWAMWKVIDPESSVDKVDKDLATKNPNMAMRLDAVRVRKKKIEKRLNDSLAGELARVKLLEKIVQPYKDASDNYSSTLTRLLISDDAGAFRSAQEATALVLGIDAAAKLHLNQQAVRDNYLFSAETVANKDTMELLGQEDRKRQTAAGEIANGRDAVKRKLASLYVSRNQLQHAVEGYALASTLLLLGNDVGALEASRAAMRTSPVAPGAGVLSQNVQSQNLAIQAMLQYRLATASRKMDREKLEQAIKDATDAIGPGGGDPANHLAHYVLGLANEARGIAETRDMPEGADAHANAKRYFAQAAKSFGEAEKVLKKVLKAKIESSAIQRTQLAFSGASGIGLGNGFVGNEAPLGEQAQGDKGLTQTLTAIQERLKDLQSAEGFLQRAQELTKEDRLADAKTELERGMEQHRNPDLWLEHTQTCLRIAKIDPAIVRQQFTRAKQAAILEPREVYSLIVDAKILLAATDRQIHLERLGADEKLKLVADFEELIQRLELAARKTDSKEMKAQCWAFAAYAVAQQSRVIPQQATDRRQSLERGLTWAVSAHQLLEAPGNLKSNSIPVREALIASRLATGLLCSEMLRPHEAEPVNALTAAMEEAAALPFKVNAINSIGAPLWNAMKRSPKNAADRRAVTERQVARSMSFFADGMLSLHENRPTTAVKQMNAGIESLPSTNGSEITAPFDGGHAWEKAFIEQNLAAYKVIALLAERHEETHGDIEATGAAKAHEALMQAVTAASKSTLPSGLSNPESSDSKKLIENAVDSVHSPLLAYALGLALEERLSANGTEAGTNREFLREQSKRAYERASEWLTPYLSNRFPGLEQRIREGQERLSDPRSFELRAKSLRDLHRLDDARFVLRDGLTMHPRDASLWEKFMVVSLDFFSIADTDQTPSHHRLLAMLDRIGDALPPLRGKLFYWRGNVYQRLQRPTDAIGSYESARKVLDAGSPDHIRATGNMAVLKGAPDRLP